jgi:hypothetical protein
MKNILIASLLMSSISGVSLLETSQVLAAPTDAPITSPATIEKPDAMKATESNKAPDAMKATGSMKATDAMKKDGAPSTSAMMKPGSKKALTIKKKAVAVKKKAVVEAVK